MGKRKLTSEQKSGFKTPESYFKNFTAQQLLAKKNELPLQSGFKTPKGYFEEFKIPPTSVAKKQKGVISLFTKKIAVILTTAAAIALLIFLNLNRTLPEKISYDSLSPQAIENYIDNNDIDFETQELDVSFDHEPQNLNKELSKIDRNSLLEYLTENTEITSLLNN